MKLGPIDIPTDLLLAPMMDVTTPSFRQLIFDIGGVGLTVTPMVFVQQIAVAPKTVLPHMELIEKQRPSAIQIVASGRNEDHIKIAIDFLNSYEFDVLDINAGCPAPHTMKSGGGGGLLRDCQFDLNGDPTRMEHIIETCLKYSDRPVSIKTRLGYERKTDILKISKRIEQSGAAFLTLHGRTVKQKYTGEADLDMIRQVKEQLNIPVVANGDVDSYETYRNMKDTTGCDAVMIGRAAMFNPRVFADIWSQKLAADKGLPLPQIPDYHDMTLIRSYLKKDLEYIEAHSKFWNTDRFKLAELRRLGIWFIKGIPGYKVVRQRLSKIQDLETLTDYLFGDEIEQDFAHSP